MDAHEKLGKLLSEYMDSTEPENHVPKDVLEAFHSFGLTEYASRENVEETYKNKINLIETELVNSGNSRFSKEYYLQQKKELSETYALISGWLNSNS